MCVPGIGDGGTCLWQDFGIMFHAQLVLEASKKGASCQLHITEGTRYTTRCAPTLCFAVLFFRSHGTTLNLSNSQLTCLDIFFQNIGEKGAKARNNKNDFCCPLSTTQLSISPSSSSSLSTPSSLLRVSVPPPPPLPSFPSSSFPPSSSCPRSSSGP